MGRNTPRKESRFDSPSPDTPDIHRLSTPNVKTATAASNRDGPREIVLTEEECLKRLYDPTSMQKALEGLHQDGLLVLKDVVDVGHVDKLREVMTSETQTILRDSERAG